MNDESNLGLNVFLVMFTCDKKSCHTRTQKQTNTIKGRRKSDVYV